METIKVCSCQHLHRLESSSCSRSCSQQLVVEFLASSLPISHIRPFTNISPLIERRKLRRWDRPRYRCWGIQGGQQVSRKGLQRKLELPRHRRKGCRHRQEGWDQPQHQGWCPQGYVLIVYCFFLVLVLTISYRGCQALNHAFNLSSRCDVTFLWVYDGWWMDGWYLHGLLLLFHATIWLGNGVGRSCYA